MHYEVDLVVLGISGQTAAQTESSTLAMSGMQKSWTNKESSTRVKFLDALRSSGVLVKNRLPREVFHGLTTERSLMTLWVLPWHRFFYVLHYGSDGKRLCRDLSCLHGFHHCCTSQGTSPPIPLARPEVSSWIAGAPGFVRIRSTG